MANAYVYPGGKLDPADTTEDILERVRDLTPPEASETLGVEPERAVGLYLAGIRETFEESGFLLARRPAESGFFDLKSDPSTARRFEEYREKLHDNEMALATLAMREDLVFPLGELAYFAHWITPTFEPRRYDTRFFIVRAPRHQTPLHDARETTDSLWIAPTEAVRRSREENFFLAPPTLRTLETLADFDTIDAVFDHCDGRNPPAILPHFETRGEEMVLLLPGDPDFPHGDPTYDQADPVDDDVTRLFLRDGTWHHG